MTFEVHIWPEKLVVEPTGSKRVNCSTSCAQPDRGGLETYLTKKLVDHQPQWQQYLVSNISKDTKVICFFSCAGKTLSKSLNISVYREWLHACMFGGLLSQGRACAYECSGVFSSSTHYSPHCPGDKQQGGAVGSDCKTTPFMVPEQTIQF